MKDFKAFVEDLKENKELAKKVNEAGSSSKKIVEIAKEAGYEVSESDIADMLMEAVSGGGTYEEWVSKINQGLQFASTVSSLFNNIVNGNNNNDTNNTSNNGDNGSSKN